MGRGAGPAEAVATSGGLPFLGRDAAVAELDAVLGAARGGRGALVLVTGEAGIGKTTLAGHAADRAAALGFAVRWGGCWVDGAAPAFWPWAQLFEAHANELDDEALARLTGADGVALGTVSPALGARLGAGATAPPTAAGPASAAAAADPANAAADPASARFALFSALARFWGRAAAAGPLLLVIEDLHWADVASVLLLAHLRPALAERPLVVLATLRGEELGDARLGPAIAELHRASPLVVELAGLPPHVLAELVRHGGLEPEPGMIDALAARTGGNPLFVTELLRTLAAGAPGGVASTRVVASEVPRHVTDVVQRRVARLPAPVAELLQAAAVLGAQGEDVVLAGTADVELAQCLANEDAAVAAGLLVADGAGRWRFTHALVRDALYRSLAPSVRHGLHDRAGGVLEAQGAPAVELARHALGALPLGDRERAVVYAAQAGRAAMHQLAYEEAAEHFASAIGALAPGAPPRPDLLLDLGEARRSGGDTDRAREAFFAAADAACDDPLPLARAALGFADPGADLGLAFRAMGDRTPALLERALAAVGPEDSALRVELLARLAAELYFSREPERSRALSEEAVAMARRVEDPRALVAALAVHHDAEVVGHADPATALAGSAELLAAARSTGDRRTLLAAHRARLFDLLVAGDLAGVDAEMEAFRLLSEELRVPAYAWWTILWRAMRALLDGRHTEAEALATQAYAIGERPFPRLAGLNLSFLLFFLRREQGRLAELEPVLRQFALENADIPSSAVGLAFGFAELGRRDEAAGLMQRLAEDDFGRMRDRNWPVSWFQLARTAVLTGDVERAGTLYEQGRPLAGQTVMVSVATVCLGSADLALAWLADALGRDDEADALYRRASATNARLGARSWLAQARADHAGFLARRGASGDADETSRLAALAHDAAVSLGLGPVRAATEPLVTAEAPVAAVATFRRDGATWVLGWGGKTVRVAHAKGLADIAWLLGHPSEPLAASELLARQDPGAEPDATPAGEVLDARARDEVRARLAELEDDADRADAANDPERGSRARAEYDELVAALAQAVGLGGRSRRLGDPSERIRKTVTARIRNSIRRIDGEHPALARHLQRSIDTGLWCVYRPEQPTAWRL